MTYDQISLSRDSTKPVAARQQEGIFKQHRAAIDSSPWGPLKSQGASYTSLWDAQCWAEWRWPRPELLLLPVWSCNTQTTDSQMLQQDWLSNLSRDSDQWRLGEDLCRIARPWRLKQIWVCSSPSSVWKRIFRSCTWSGQRCRSQASGC